MPPPFRYVSFPISSVLVFLSLVIVLFSLPACPEPSTHHDGFVEQHPDGGVEKIVLPEESVSPEDGAPSEEPYTETEPEKPDIPDTKNVLIAQIEGDDDQVQAVSYPSGTTPPADAKPAAFRFRTAWRVYGANLQRIDTWQLQSKDNTQTFLTLTDFVYSVI